MEKHCNHCGVVNAVFQETPESIHYAKWICPICGLFIEWIPKPKNKDKRTRSKYSPQNLNIGFCEICGRIHLGQSETLEIHHKIPIEEGGQDTRENVLVLCTPCHRMTHFLRIYLNHHLDNFYSFYIAKNEKRST